MTLRIAQVSQLYNKHSLQPLDSWAADAKLQQSDLLLNRIITFAGSCKRNETAVSSELLRPTRLLGSKCQTQGNASMHMGCLLLPNCQWH